MDEQNPGVNERWQGARDVPERGYAEESPGDRRTAEIRAEIERTRADMTETVDAIQEKLRPANLASQAKDTVREATVGKVKEMATNARETLTGRNGGYDGEYGIMDRIRENPLPTAIAAASIAWIAFGSRGSRREMRPAIYGSTRPGGRAFVEETVISADVEFHDGDDTSGIGTDVTRAGRSAADGMRRRARTTQTRLQRMMRENPLAVGAIAAAVGVTVGMALPETERENELMGEAREAVVNRAQDAARGAAERVQDAAQHVQRAAGEAARSLTGEESSNG